MEWISWVHSKKRCVRRYTPHCNKKKKKYLFSLYTGVSINREYRNFESASTETYVAYIMERIVNTSISCVLFVYFYVYTCDNAGCDVI